MAVLLLVGLSGVPRDFSSGFLYFLGGGGGGVVVVVVGVVVLYCPLWVKRPGISI